MNQKLAKISKSFYFTVIIILLVSTSFSCNKKNATPEIKKNLNQIETTSNKKEVKMEKKDTTKTEKDNSNKKTVVKVGDTISVMYIGKLTDGTIFDQSKEGHPLTFKVGAGRMIKGFDKGVVGMKLNEEKTVEIPAKEAYGPKNPGLVHAFDRAQFPKDFVVEKGKTVTFRDRSNRPRRGVIVDFTKDKVTVDFNHELAGKDLVFTITVIDIK